MKICRDTHKRCVEYDKSDMRSYAEKAERHRGAARLNDLEWLSVYQFRLAVDNYGATEDCDALRSDLGTAVERFSEVLELSQQQRDEQRRRSRNHSLGPYDICAMVDFYFALCLAWYVVVRDCSSVTQVCQNANPGRYQGKPKVNSHEGVFCRMVRAFHLEDEPWLLEELETLRTLSASYDCSHEMFALPKSRWHPLFHSLFFGEERDFWQAVKGAEKWYRKVARERGQIVGSDGLYTARSYYMVLMAAIKMGVVHRGFTFDMDSEFLPPHSIVAWK